MNCKVKSCCKPIYPIKRFTITTFWFVADSGKLKVNCGCEATVDWKIKKISLLCLLLQHLFKIKINETLSSVENFSRSFFLLIRHVNADHDKNLGSKDVCRKQQTVLLIFKTWFVQNRPLRHLHERWFSWSFYCNVIFHSLGFYEAWNLIEACLQHWDARSI